MKLSIILRTFNRLEYTIRTIMSIDKNCGLSKDDYEIICVDQNSSDGTKEWLAFNSKEGYYPIVPFLLSENIGDGRGMQAGINIAKGDFIAQHDGDIELMTPDYYRKMIELYEEMELRNLKVCAIGGQHRQGVNKESAPWKFGRKRYSSIVNGQKVNAKLVVNNYILYPISWVTASFIFRKKFTSILFTKRMCNSWCSIWWDKGYDNFSCETLKFWHIDSSSEGGEYVQKQYDKFPFYSYIFKNYRKFIDEKTKNLAARES